MNKEQKIKELTDKIQELSKELCELSSEEVKDPRHVEVFTGHGNCYFMYIADNGTLIRDSAIYDMRLRFHNVFPLDVGHGQQLNYQKIINRLWQLAYHLNPSGWDWEKEIEAGYCVYEVCYDYESKRWTTSGLSLYRHDFFGVCPKFKHKVDAKQAADDLNAKEYHL